VVDLVDFLGLSEAILDVLLYVKAIHIPEIGEVFNIEELLLECVSVLSVINYRFSTAGSYSPLIVRLKEGDIKGKDLLLKIDQIVLGDLQRLPRSHENQKDQSEPRHSCHVNPTRKDLQALHIVSSCLGIFNLYPAKVLGIV